MKIEKKHADIANKYCRTVTFYPDPSDPYTVEEVIATKQQAADKKRFILAYLQALESLSPWFQDAMKDKQKLKLFAAELAGARDALFYLWHVSYPKTSAWENMMVVLNRAGEDLYPVEYLKFFPK